MGNLANREQVVKTGDVVEGRYRIIRTLGEGGMGTVFLAEHALIKRRVAIKILHPELATDADVIERFMNEARAAGTLGHPNIVESTDMGFTHNHVPYIVFEYLEGTLLTDEIYRVGGLPVRRAMRIAQQIASALHAAHNAGVIHRDLKSDNVFLTDKDDALDHVKVLDFGISRFLEADDNQTARGMVMGTPEFMAPEQITAPQSVDRRTDVYALGVILYEMLTARRPFSNDEDPRALMTRIVNNAPPPMQRPEVPHALQEMIMTRMLAKDPSQRHQSMIDVEAALEAFYTGDGVGRRSRPIPVVTQSDEIPARARMIETPWPPKHADTIDKAVSLPPPPAAKRPWALYGIAGAGLLIGGFGLAMGMKGGSGDGGAKTAAAQPTPAPAPAALPAASVPAAPAPASKIDVKIEASVPNARVTFRRRVSEAPTSVEITPSDIVEIVEISAPGYKTERYWLTLDRPTHLNAKLVKGAGLEEASEEATLIALGEAQAPAPVAVAAVQPAAPIEKHTEVAVAVAEPAARPAPRKIGRGSAEETKASVEESKPEPIAAVVDQQRPAAMEPVPAPAPAPVADEPAPVKTVEPVVAKPIAPGIDRATAASVLAKHSAEILKCFDEGKKAMPGMHGTLQLKLAVDAAGAVRPMVSSGLASPQVVACVTKTASAWRFPARDGGEIAEVTYPFSVSSDVPAPAVVDGSPKGIERAEAASVVTSHNADVVACINIGKRKDKDLHGKMALALHIDQAGMARAQISSTLGDKEVEDCVLKTATTWKFPAHAGAKITTVVFPFAVK